MGTKIIVYTSFMHKTRNPTSPNVSRHFLREIIRGDGVKLAHKYTAEIAYTPREFGNVRLTCARCGWFRTVSPIPPVFPSRKYTPIGYIRKPPSTYMRNQPLPLRYPRYIHANPTAHIRPYRTHYATPTLTTRLTHR